MSGIYKRAHILLLAAYVASLLVGTIKVLPETSVSFVLGFMWGASKLLGWVFHDRTFRPGAEGIMLMALYLYMAGVDALVHGGSLSSPYYISFGLNCVMTLLLIDEFAKSAWLRDKMMQVFSAAAVLVALLLSAGVFTTQSQSGRFTFMAQNENDLALNFLIAFVFVATRFVRSVPKTFLLRVLAYASTLLLLSTLVYTGSRSAIFSVCVVLLLLAATSSQRKNAMKACLAYIFTSAAFLAIKMFNFQPALERFSPEIDGNNLTDLGGRIPLWQSSLDVFIAHPFFGIGLNGFQKHVLQTGKYFGMPHNFLLEVAVISGLVGVALLLLLAGIFIIRAVRQFVQFGMTEGLIWGVVIFVTAAMFNITHMKAFWLLVAYFTAVVSLPPKNVADRTVNLA